jgi:hypothetical protein
VIRGRKEGKFEHIYTWALNSLWLSCRMVQGGGFLIVLYPSTSRAWVSKSVAASFLGRSLDKLAFKPNCKTLWPNRRTIILLYSFPAIVSQNSIQLCVSNFPRNTNPSCSSENKLEQRDANDVHVSCPKDTRDSVSRFHLSASPCFG